MSTLPVLITGADDPLDLSSSPSKSRPRLKRTEAHTSLQSSVDSGDYSPQSSPDPAVSKPTSANNSSSLANLLSPVSASQGPVTAFSYIKQTPSIALTSAPATALLAAGLNSSSSSTSAGPCSSSPDLSPVNNALSVQSPFGTASLAATKVSTGTSVSPRGGSSIKRDKKEKRDRKDLKRSTNTLSLVIQPPAAGVLTTASEPDWACMPPLTTAKLEPLRSILVTLAQIALTQLRPPAHSATSPSTIRWVLMPPLSAVYQDKWHTTSASAPAVATAARSTAALAQATAMMDMPPPAPSRANLLTGSKGKSIGKP